MLELIKKITSFTPKRILVVGDLMLDEYKIGDCTRMSPEAPFPVLKVTERKYNAGGAGNTAMNIQALGSVPYLIGLVGKDENGQKVKQSLQDYRISTEGLLSSLHMNTPIKSRPIARGQQVGPRIDECDDIPYSKEHDEFILSKFSQNLPMSDVVCISDYAKGTLSEEMIVELLKRASSSRKPVIIGTRPAHTTSYKNASFIAQNFKESCEMTNQYLRMNLENAAILARALYETLNSKVVLTMANAGIYYYDETHSEHFPTFPRQVADVSGAGDTVVAAWAVGYVNGLNIYELGNFANHAGGVKVEKLGVQPVNLEEVIKDIKIHNNLE